MGEFRGAVYAPGRKEEEEVKEGGTFEEFL
jgi:hypothetical protein